MRTIAPEQLSQDTRKLLEVMSAEKDLPCVVLGAAFLDSVLATLLEAHLRDASVARKLLAPQAPLGTYGARSDLAYSLGLIKKSHHRDLQTIGRIRNRFAHSHLALSFDDHSLQQLSDELKEWRIVRHVIPDEARTNHEPLTPEARRRNARMQFNLTVAFLANWLLLAALSEKKKRTERPRPTESA